MKKVFLFAAIALLPFLGTAQTKAQNYIKSTTYQVATSDTLVADDDKIESITYVDGLGRPMQSISTRAGGNRENIVSYIEYDELGMQPKQYLPWASNGQVPVSSALDFISPGTLSSSIGSFYNTPKYENTINPYSETRYEKSPLFRPLEQAAPGNSWKLANGHTIKFDYQLNNNVVYQFSVNFNNGDYSDPELVYDTNYTNNELLVSVTRDENWQTTDGIHGKTFEFKNKSGQVVLKRTSVEDPFQGPQNANYHDTYYVYDDYGNLTYVLSPEASDNILNGSSINQGVLNNLGYQYKYDRRNRLVWKKLPGKGFEVIIYDTQDRPILTQDALMRAANPYKYLFTKYDCLGRVAYTGFHISSYTLYTDVQNDVPNVSNCEVMPSNSGLVGDTQMYYTNTAYPSTSLEILTINYYDTHVDYTGLTRPTNIYGVNPSFTDTQGLPTVSKVRVLGTND
ncbi:MAG: hypothetical protein JKY22_11910 [Flavobacteriaceae bacterium]|nr:hypothetical protein [Flavobacteriaceae bacterium]